MLAQVSFCESRMTKTPDQKWCYRHPDTGRMPDFVASHLFKHQLLYQSDCTRQAGQDAQTTIVLWNLSRDLKYVNLLKLN